VLTGRTASRLDAVGLAIEARGGAADALPWDVTHTDSAPELVGAADIFESDEELEDFLAFTYAERHRDLA
jgi:hypothetical protein